MDYCRKDHGLVISKGYQSSPYGGGDRLRSNIVQLSFGWVTLPRAVQFIICVQTNGGIIKQLKIRLNCLMSSYEVIAWLKTAFF